MAKTSTKKKKISEAILLKAYDLMCTARHMSDIYEENQKMTSKYVHATSRGHEAVQLACGMQLKAQDFVAPYYRDDSILLGIGMSSYELMLQLFAKKDDPFSGGRTYYCHPSLNDPKKPKITHQSSATGMQAIPATGIAMGVQYKEDQGLDDRKVKEKPVVICSLGDASMTEGEISEALQMAALKQYPIIYLVQDNEWDISAHASEIRANDATQFVKGFKGIEAIKIDGSNFIESYNTFQEVIETVRKERRPFLIHAKVPLLGHHTSGVRREWYRDDLEEHEKRDPFPKFRDQLLDLGLEKEMLNEIENLTKKRVKKDLKSAQKADEPVLDDLFQHAYAPSEIIEEKGEREPSDGEEILMVDCALFGVEEILREHPEALLYGQDVGGRLGGVFREAATLAQKFGDKRVFNTPIVEAFIIGSTVGMAATGCRPIVEVQFADYIWPGLNQLFTELSRSYFLSNGKWPATSLIRVPIGAYGSGGPYHSSSVESVLCNIKGIKVVYPSNGADLKGLMKGAFYDPNPVVMLEHKGLYWSKLPGTEEAKCIEPSEDYIIPLGKGRIVQEATDAHIRSGKSACIVTYGMGVYWSKMASNEFANQIEIIDLRTLMPLDEDLIFERVKLHGKCMVVTEESWKNSFAQALTGSIQNECFEQLDAPVMLIGSENLPAIPLNSEMEAGVIPNGIKVGEKLRDLMSY